VFPAEEETFYRLTLSLHFLARSSAAFCDKAVQGSKSGGTKKGGKGGCSCDYAKSPLKAVKKITEEEWGVRARVEGLAIKTGCADQSAVSEPSH